MAMAVTELWTGSVISWGGSLLCIFIAANGLIAVSVVSCYTCDDMISVAPISLLTYNALHYRSNNNNNKLYPPNEEGLRLLF